MWLVCLSVCLYRVPVDTHGAQHHATVTSLLRDELSAVFGSGRAGRDYVDTYLQRTRTSLPHVAALAPALVASGVASASGTYICCVCVCVCMSMRTGVASCGACAE